MKIKDKALIIFSDIDETFTPIGIKGLQAFVELVKEIQEKEKVIVKFCPISGRNGEYVRAVMNMINSVFNEAGISRFSEFGAGEQGSVLVGIDKPNTVEFLGREEDKKVKKIVSKIVEGSGASKFLVEAHNNEYINTFHIKDELKPIISNQMVENILTSVRANLETKLKNIVHVSHVVDCLEVVPVSVGKDKALRRIFEEFQKKYNILGITFSGDSENDLRAVKYVSRLSLVPGIKANVILPSNCYTILELKNLEKWRRNCITKSDEARFSGVMKIIKEKLDNKQLLDRGLCISRTIDDLGLIWIGKNRDLSKMNSVFGMPTI